MKLWMDFYVDSYTGVGSKALNGFPCCLLHRSLTLFFFAGALEQGRCNLEQFTPHGSLVQESPSSSLVSLEKYPGALGGGIRTAGSARAFALGSNTTAGLLGTGTLGKGPKPSA